MKASIERLDVGAYTIPTDNPESDGTLEWTETTMVLVRVFGGGLEGIGYTYGHSSIVQVIRSILAPLVLGKSVLDIEGLWAAMVSRVRNNGQTGLAMMAISAVDIALWDLKAKLLGLPLCSLLGQAREGMPIYGSGGFTSYTDEQLTEQLSGWVGQGISAMKIKVGRDPGGDKYRVQLAREAIGPSVELFVDANAAYSCSQALSIAEGFAKFGVSWLEEPVAADELEQLAFIRSQMPSGMKVAAGEYAYRLSDLRALLTAGAVDVLQADATRCGGVTGFLKAGHLAEAFHVPLSSHCAPGVHLHPVLSLNAFSIAEYFHDHVRIESQFFDGVASPREGKLFPDLSALGNGLVLREAAISGFRVA
jgi:L-alanine-DL-glutamate epimerase-like enolase superfamily enzyme